MNPRSNLKSLVKMRMFIAIDVSEELKGYLAGVQKEIYSEFAKLVFTSDFHITLKFLGDVSEEKFQEIINSLDKINSKKFSLQIDKLGFFDSEDYLKVIWAGVSPHDNVNELQKQVEDSLIGLFPRDKFHPHITLARVKYVFDKEKFVSLMKSIKVNPIFFSVEKFVLYKSTLTRDGPVYEVVKVFEIGWY